ncbi:MAG: FHA domain-containing protein [Anaerolineae bacterium]|jgi:hypothetical protein|nr:FHA domain-containing protein [Anaerolineae bacterium]
MAYGRLDVFWPDGKFETFALDEATVSVGRSSGNTLMLDTDTISRYHITLVRDQGQTLLTDLDSINGTFIDGVRVKSNTPLPLNGGEEIQIGYLRLLYYTLDETPTVQMPVTSEDTARIEKETPTFKIDLQEPQIAVAPGSYTSAELNITNISDTPQTFSVQISGLPEGWSRVNRPFLELDPKENALVLINIKPLRRSDSAPGEYIPRATVSVHEKPDEKIEVPFRVMILPYSGFGMALAARRIGVQERFKLYVHNQGSGPLPLYIVGQDARKQLQFNIKPSQITLSPGQRMQIQGEIKPLRGQLFGGMQEYPFDLVVKSMDNAHFSASIRGHLLYRPTFPLWLAGLATLAVLALFAVVFLGLASLLTRTPTPEIQSFLVNQGIQEVRGALEITWEVENAEEISVRVNDLILLSGVDPEQGEAQINTGDLSGEARVELIAVNGDQQVTQTRTVTIIAPIAIVQFEVTPSTLYRHVTQSLTINYNAPTAIEVQLTGLAGVAPNPFLPLTANNGSIALVILPSNNFSLTLTAIDASGESVQQVLNVSLLEARCSAIGTNVNLYQAPDLTSNVISTLSAGGEIVANGRTPTSDWIRTTLNGVDVWGASANFTCLGFEVSALRDVALPPLRTTPIAPPLTVVPTLNLTPLPTPTIDPSGL